MDFPYELIRSRRRTVSLQIRTDGTLLVRCPMNMPQRNVDAFVESKAAWITGQLERLSRDLAAEYLTPPQLQELAVAANQVIPERAAYLARQMGVSYGRITIRNQKTRWGSCSSKGNLNFNCLLMLTPPPVMDYVIVHELCHRLEMNPSKAFWLLVERYCPDWKASRKWLKDHGGALIIHNKRIDRFHSSRL